MSARLTVEELQRSLGGEIAKGKNGKGVLCPGPGHSSNDRSLSVMPADNGDGFVVHSFTNDDPIACRDYIRQKLALPPLEQKKTKKGGSSVKSWTLISEHTYRTEAGEPYLRVRKCHDENDKKQYPQAHWNGQYWVKGKPDGAKLPYRLPELIAAPPTITIYFCEGEKDADNLAKLGFVATTASEGAGAKWDQELTKWFKDRLVVILPDADRAGRAHAQKVAKAVNGVATSVRVCDLFPDSLDGSDVSDWLKNDPSGARLVKECQHAELWQPSADDDYTASGDNEVIAELAKLSKLDYAKRRKEAAAELGIGAGELDKIVAEQHTGGEPKAKPPLYSHWTVEPWDEPVDGDILIQTLIEKIQRHVVMAPDQALAAALWIILTWIHDDVVVHSPILLVTSAEANSGKTTLVGVIGFLARRGLLTDSISGPALFRSIEKWQPTFAIDEADTALVSNPDLKQVINSGWTRNRGAIRCDPETNEPRVYSTFAPKCLGMKGRELPDTTLSRTIIIEMKRKRPEETAVDFGHVDDAELAALRRQLLCWANDNVAALAAATPGMPADFDNRVRSNWKVLLAIAERLGTDWKRRALQAAVAIEKVRATFDTSIGVALLEAIRAMFEPGIDCLLSREIITKLTADPEQPWVEYKNGKPITQKQLGALLRLYSIISETVHPPDGAHGRGYKKERFDEAFGRYLPSLTENRISTRASVQVPLPQRQDGQTRSVQEEVPHTSKSDHLAHSHGGSHTCTLPNGEMAQEGQIGDIAAPIPEPTQVAADAPSPAAEPIPTTTRPSPAPQLSKVAIAKAEPVDDVPDFLRRCIQCGNPSDANGAVTAHKVGDVLLWLHPQCHGFRLRHPTAEFHPSVQRTAITAEQRQ